MKPTKTQTFEPQMRPEKLNIFDWYIDCEVCTEQWKQGITRHAPH